MLFIIHEIPTASVEAFVEGVVIFLLALESKIAVCGDEQCIKMTNSILVFVVLRSEFTLTFFECLTVPPLIPRR